MAKPKRLTDTKSWLEAEKVLNANKASAPVRYLTSLAYRFTDEEEKDKALQHAEEMMDVEHGGEKNAQQQKQDNKENENPRAGTEGSELHGNPSGDPGSDVPEPEAPEGKGSGEQTASEQPGVSQGGGDKNVENHSPYELMDEPPNDMMNACIIEQMGNGMSQVEAQNHCAAQMRGQMGVMKEAMKPMKEALIKRDKIIDNQGKEIAHLKEAIQMISSKGTISMTKTKGPGGNLNQESLTPGQDPTVSDSLKVIEEIATDPIRTEDFKKNILNSY